MGYFCTEKNVYCDRATSSGSCYEDSCTRKFTNGEHKCEICDNLVLDKDAHICSHCKQILKYIINSTNIE